MMEGPFSVLSLPQENMEDACFYLILSAICPHFVANLRLIGPTSLYSKKKIQRHPTWRFHHQVAAG